MTDLGLGLAVLAVPVGWSLGILIAELGQKSKDKKREAAQVREMAGPHPLSEKLAREMTGVDR